MNMKSVSENVVLMVCIKYFVDVDVFVYIKYEMIE